MPSRVAKLQSEKFNKNVDLRGKVPKTQIVCFSRCLLRSLLVPSKLWLLQKKGESYPLGPWALGFLVFVVVGSSPYFS
jgi:hypothetical protein